MTGAEKSSQTCGGKHAHAQKCCSPGAGCGKPDFFIQKKPLFEVHLDTGMLYNTDGGTPMVRSLLSNCNHVGPWLLRKPASSCFHKTLRLGGL